MKTIQIDNEVYSGLLENVSDFGETPNSVLRRLLRLEGDARSEGSEKSPEISALLESMEFRLAKGVVGRFLLILSWLHQRNPNEFHLVENVKGRGRIYFAESAELLKQSGKSVNPKKIPESPYWVISTTPTDLKQDILENVMKLLRCDEDSIRLAREAIAK